MAQTIKELRAQCIIAMVCCIFSLSLCACGKKTTEHTANVAILTDQSYFSDVTTDGTNVYYSYVLSIENSEDTDTKITLIGDFSWEYQAGIIDTNILTGIAADGSVIFLLPAHSVKEYPVTFSAQIGKTKSTVLKQDRNLPEITIRKATGKQL